MWLLYRFVFLTSRIEIRGKDILKDMRGKPAIFTCWHGRGITFARFMQSQKLTGYIIVSNNPEGRIAGNAARLFGFRSIYGGAGRQLNVLKEGVRVLQKGKSLNLTPDGPRGPRMVLNDGILYFAKMTGAPIIPMCLSATHHKIIRVWDRHMIILPFGKIIVEAKEPIYFNRDNPNEMEDLHIRLSDIMTKQQQALDAETGVKEIIEPEGVNS